MLTTVARGLGRFRTVHQGICTERVECVLGTINLTLTPRGVYPNTVRSTENWEGPYPRAAHGDWEGPYPRAEHGDWEVPYSVRSPVRSSVRSTVRSIVRSTETGSIGS